MKILLVCLLIALASLSVFAQEEVKFDYGRPSELKSLTKIFIFSGVDHLNRDRIEKQIKKDLPNIEILDSKDEAEIVLVFAGGKINEVLGATTNRTGNTAITNVNSVERKTGVGQVFLQFKDERKLPRLILEVASTQGKIGENKPATKFAKEFIKA